MFWLGMICGFGIGFGLLSIRSCHREIEQVCTELEREIAADNLECAREERRAAALRVIARNEQEARS